ncbi:hypothetical protein WJX81_008362 [Elliptochloris bilobata]|uniref:Tyrosine specific protein phosphatases domain-containing protein n=1 Tax=Elliptochloris bilobata TaxID=381761 RepID=A0AAW1S8E2_9CHLO
MRFNAAPASHPPCQPAASDAAGGAAAGPQLAEAQSHYSASPPAKSEKAAKASVVDVLDRASMAGQKRPLEEGPVAAPEPGEQATTKHKRTPSASVNLRDVGAGAGHKANLKEGALFRASQILSADEMRRYGMRTILDLRRMDRPCKKAASNVHEARMRRLGTIISKGPDLIYPEKGKLYATRGHPKPCVPCQRHLEESIGFRAEAVMHADLIPTFVGLRIFAAMPQRVRMQAIVAAFRGKGASSVMAPAVANPLYMGYKVLYKTMLEDSKRGIATALRVFAEAENYPILIHCIHGKDRTGIVVMLLLLLCGVKREAIVEDYMMSEKVLKQSRMHNELDLDVYLTADDVIAATRDTMEATLDYLDHKYGDIDHYCRECGMEPWELSRIRVNLLEQTHPHDQELAAEGKKDALAPLKKMLEPMLSPGPGIKRQSQAMEAPAPKGGQEVTAH